MGRVVIRTKKKYHGTMLSVYLEFCPPFTDNCGKQVRYEFLDLEKYTTPANEAQQKFNATIDDNVAVEILQEIFIDSPFG